MKNYKGLLRFARNDEGKLNSLFSPTFVTVSRHCDEGMAGFV